MEEARAFEFIATALPVLSVLIGQVPVMENPLAIIASSIVSQPVDDIEFTPSSSFSDSDCLNA
jgi:hypothetical protein